MVCNVLKAATNPGGLMSNTFRSLVSVSAFLGLISPAWSMTVDVSEAPTTNLGLTISAIQSAQHTLLLNIYELSSPEIADALVGRIQAGVNVRIIEEGQPVGGMSAAAKGIQSQLVQAMQSARGGDHLFEMTSKAGGKRRFRFDHAKYAVIDGSDLLIGSENYSPTGNPQPGTLGNRGWEVLIHDQALATQFAATFASDSDTSYQDVEDLVGGGAALAQNLAAPKSPPVFSGTSLPADGVTALTSPDTSLNGLTNLIRNAKSSIDIELMTFDPGWAKVAAQNPLIPELIAARKRGVTVRVLLNDETVFDHASKPAKPKNPVTESQLTQGGVQAITANLKGMGVDYIHNKGVLVDGNQTLISYINWDENSIEHNREAAVVIDSPSIFAHYEALFEKDWEVSGGAAKALQPALRAFRFAPASDVGISPAPSGLIDSENCPDKLELTAAIGALSISDSDDQSFSSLANKNIKVSLSRQAFVKGCVLGSQVQIESGSSRPVTFEIRLDSRKEQLFALEGYTSSGKLFSIRAKSGGGVPSGASLAAIVYDGSGPKHEKLGDATLGLTEL